MRMGANVAVETLVGVIPFVGDLFDFVWKANQRNVKLLQAHVHDPVHTAKASRTLIIVIGVSLIFLIGGGIYLAALFLHWLWVTVAA